MRVSARFFAGLAASVSMLALAGCGGGGGGGTRFLLPAASASSATGSQVSESYVIGPMDELTIFVWRNAELGANVQVRPDGRITTPLISDMIAAGKTPAQLADDIREVLTRYINDPQVSVILNRPQGTFSQQIRIVGATARPAAIP